MGSHFDAPKLVFKERAGRARRFPRGVLAGHCVQPHASFRELEFGPRKNRWQCSYGVLSPRDALTNFCNGDAEVLRWRYVLWYYPEKPAAGFVFYTIAL